MTSHVNVHVNIAPCIYIGENSHETSSHLVIIFNIGFPKSQYLRITTGEVLKLRITVSTGQYITSFTVYTRYTSYVTFFIHSPSFPIPTSDLFPHLLRIRYPHLQGRRLTTDLLGTYNLTKDTGGAGTCRSTYLLDGNLGRWYWYSECVTIIII